MKTKMKACMSTSVFPIGCFLFLLLSINLDCKSLTFNGIYSIIDSSGSNFLSVNYILNNNVETEKEVQMESWMMELDFVQSSDVFDAYENTLTDEVNYSFENWMSNPDMFISSDGDDVPGEEILSEESIRFENWMINTTSWIEKPCNL